MKTVKIDRAAARKRAGVSQNEAAVRARVSPPTARLFELAGPSAVTNEACRARLIAVYAAFEAAAAEAELPRV